MMDLGNQPKKPKIIQVIAKLKTLIKAFQNSLDEEDLKVWRILFVFLCFFKKTFNEMFQNTNKNCIMFEKSLVESQNEYDKG